MTVIKAAAVQMSPVLYSREGTVDKVCPADHRPRSPGRAVRHLPGDGGAVLPLFLLRAAAVPDGRGTPQAARTSGRPCRRPPPRPSARPAGKRGWWCPSASTSATAARSITRSCCSMPTARLIQRRRKISPTYHERMVWGQGDGSGLRAVDSAVGRIGQLACWEHYNPLARYALMADGEQIHSAMYPGSFAGDLFAEQIAGQHPPARPGIRLLRRQRHRLAGRRSAGPDHEGHRLPHRPDLGRLLHRDRLAGRRIDRRAPALR